MGKDTGKHNPSGVSAAKAHSSPNPCNALNRLHPQAPEERIHTIYMFRTTAMEKSNTTDLATVHSALCSPQKRTSLFFFFL